MYALMIRNKNELGILRFKEFQRFIIKYMFLELLIHIGNMFAQDIHLHFNYITTY